MRIALSVAVALAAGVASAGQGAPGSVTVAGSFQSEAGCPSDWQPDCALTHLAYDAGDDVWQAAFALPAGAFEYRAALDDSWTVNYGANAAPGGANLALALGTAAPVKFYYDGHTHWVTDDQSAVIATVPGSFQGELGCPADWDPGCLRSWLEDPDGDGIYAFSSGPLPAGSYEAKVAHGETWDENYGAGGVPMGANIPFSVPANGTRMSFRYDPATHLLTIEVPEPSQGALLGGALALIAARTLRRELPRRRGFNVGAAGG